MSEWISVEDRLSDIKNHPEKHQHDFVGLAACCMIDGSYVLRIQSAHEGLVPQRNPRPCDVTKGPCSCGAWH